MPSDEILDELLRPSILREDIIVLAWPSLSVESKLQVISVYQKDIWSSLPDEIFEVAGSDSSPIVRFWSCRFQQAAQIRSDDKSFEVSDGKSKVLWGRHSSEAVELAKSLIEDENQLIGDLAAIESNFFSGPVEPLTNSQRLLAMKYSDQIGLDGTIEWIEKLIEDARLSEKQLNSIIMEFLGSPRIKIELNPDEMSQDGMSHAANINTGRNIWELSKKLPNSSATVIGYYAPVIVEKANVLKEVFDNLPPATQAAAIGRNNNGIEEIAEMVRSNSDQYDGKVTDALELADKYSYDLPTADEIQENQIINSNNKLQELLKLTIELKKQLGLLKVGQKGFFG